MAIRSSTWPATPTTRSRSDTPARRAGASGDLHHHPDRLDAPLIRNPADDTLYPTSWDAALDHVTDTLRRIIGESGPNAVAAYRASGWGFDFPGAMVSDPFFRGLGSDQIYSAITIDGPNKVFVPELISGATLPWSTPDVSVTDCLLLVGQNPLVSHGHANVVPNPVVTLRAIKARGTIVVADPRITETARLADVHVRLKPGSDPAFLAYLAREAFAARRRRRVPRGMRRSGFGRARASGS